jgi:RND family efflux transporter MFP subunit
VLGVALGVGLLSLAACGPEAAEDAAATADRATVRVRVQPAAMEDWPDRIEATGTVRARVAATLSSRAMGYIREMRYQEGDRVEAGAVVATLEARELQIAVQRAESGLEEIRGAVPEAESAVASASAQLTLAETTLRRMQDLLAKRSVSQQEFDEADARVRVARSGKEMAEAKRRQLDQKIRQAQDAVSAAQVQTEFLEVKAPFAGRVTARRAEPGMLASPGMPLLEVEREGSYRLEVAMPESQLRSVRVGQGMEVRLDSDEAALAARVDEIVPEIDPASRTFIVKLALPAAANVRAGSFGRASFATGSRQVLTVPASAVIAQGQLRNVLVAPRDVAQSRMIRVGGERDGRVEVLSGIEEGERVIAPVPAGLADGQRIEVTP